MANSNHVSNECGVADLKEFLYEKDVSFNNDKLAFEVKDALVRLVDDVLKTKLDTKELPELNRFGNILKLVYEFNELYHQSLVEAKVSSDKY